MHMLELIGQLTCYLASSSTDVNSIVKLTSFFGVVFINEVEGRLVVCWAEVGVLAT
jgi:hypothetical protein